MAGRWHARGARVRLGRLFRRERDGAQRRRAFQDMAISRAGRPTIFDAPRAAYIAGHESQVDDDAKKTYYIIRRFITGKQHASEVPIGHIVASAAWPADRLGAIITYFPYAI